jgi:hypothetical protein
VRTRPLIQTLRRMADAMEQCCPPLEEGEQEKKKEAAVDPPPETAARISGARDEAREQIDER